MKKEELQNGAGRAAAAYIPGDPFNTKHYH